MADGKWISDLCGSTPVAEAARRVLTVRLGVVHERLPLAVKEADKDAEHVHQLRVGTRRAAAALKIFSLCLPGKPRRRARKRLKAIRRAAGAARDWDVFSEALAGRLRRARVDQRVGLDFLLGYASGQRAAAQQSLESAGARFESGFDRLVSDTLAAVRAPDDVGIRTLQDLARPTLGRLLAQLQTAAAANLNAYEHLHQVRILGKQLRYAMEVFESCYGAAFQEQYYSAVQEMQEILGRANDSYVAAQRLGALRARLMTVRPREWKRYQGGIEALLAYHQRRLPSEQRRFVRWWRRWLQSGAEQAFAALLLGQQQNGCLRLSGSER